ncbi:MAG: protein-L-isoaspartate(D-aspartate) O-methyltransferase [Opitutales bacterium]|nr:protein-L-isoaspartate(D-aspartate) O-methyltransferase [Opitutales bacterium]
MIRDQIESRGVSDPLVLKAMRAVPRHAFVPEKFRSQAEADSPLPIGLDQTISQPYVVAAMTELIHPKAGGKVLEIGTGSGYQAAVLAEIGMEVYSIEILELLGMQAKRNLEAAGYTDLYLWIGDGNKGWPEAAPFDSIIVTAAPPRIPQALKEQLKVGGRMVIPVGQSYQELFVITRTEDGWNEETVFPVRFVPMTGEVR